jgi:FkbH-like protein
MALDGERLQRISENVEQFGAALAASARRAAASLFVFACPASPDTASIEAIERRLEDLTSEAGCYFVSSAELRSTYAVADGFDPQGDCLAHIPYRPEQFAALGTMIVRKIQALGNARYKVVVLDCDQTLWRGVCGEDGPLGVELDSPALSLQEFMREQREAGMLLCLCSRNNLADVRAAFDRPDMRLRWEDLAAYRVNWRPKPNNLEDLSVELGLPLDSFIFIDDDPLECARARAQCPAVLTLQLPADRDAIAQSLRHIWAFDRLRATADDRARADHYRSEEQRESARARSLDWAEFARELEIEMDIRPAVAADIPRISQLVMRTNQFNASGSRWSEQQLRRMLADGYKGYTARVRDRFGDYGLVGAALFRRAGDALRVDTLAVSCRALGRGVEHRLIQVVGESADRSDVSAVEVVFTPGERNQPALDFLESAAQGQRPEGPRTIYRLSPAALPEITHECL